MKLTPEYVAYLFDESARKAMEAFGEKEILSNVLDTPLTWLFNKQMAYHSEKEIYLKQIEEDVTLNHELAYAYNVLLGRYLCSQELGAFSQEDILGALRFHLSLARETSEHHVNYLRDGCKGCEVHSRHSYWDRYKKLRDAKDKKYIEELEFLCIYHKALAETSSLFVQGILAMPDLEGAFLSVDLMDAIDVIEQRTDLWARIWIGLIKPQNLQFDHDDAPQVLPIELLPDRSWMRVWGHRFRKLVTADLDKSQSPDLKKGNRIRIRDEYFELVQSPDTTNRLVVIMNAFNFKCPMSINLGWFHNKTCGKWMQVLLDFAPSVWICPNCGGVIIIDNRNKVQDHKRPNLILPAPNDLNLLCYFDGQEKLKKMDFVRYLIGINKSYKLVRAQSFDEGMQEVFEQGSKKTALFIPEAFDPEELQKKFVLAEGL